MFKGNIYFSDYKLLRVKVSVMFKFWVLVGKFVFDRCVLGILKIFYVRIEEIS